MQERFEVSLDSHYKIEKRFGTVGEGGYGSVFVARDKGVENGRLVAIKKVVKKTEMLAEAIHKEVRVMKELDHPNICRLLESFEDERIIYLVMEYCEGGELFDRIVQEKSFDEQNAANIVVQVASALRYAHSRNIAHRDLKPENVCFCKKETDAQGQVKVIDWGLSGLFEGDDMLQTAVGSLSYTAPEVLRRSIAYDTSCDLWSLGVLIYVMLSGKPPFWGNQQVIVQRILHAKYPMTGHPWDLISSEAKSIIKGLLVVDPSERMGITDVMDHSWLRDRHTNVSNPQAASAILDNMRNYKGLSTFRSLCVSAVARHLDHHDLEAVHMVFRELDKNGDGVLSLDEVKNGFRRIYGDKVGTDADIEKLFRAMDIGCSGSIDYTEFCAAAVNFKSGVTEDVLWSAFRAFDLDNTGMISVGELARTLEAGLKIPGADTDSFHQAAQVFIERYDVSGDRMIDFEEWKHMIQDFEPNKKIDDDLDTQPDLSKREISRKLASGKKIPSNDAYDLLLKNAGLGEGMKEVLSRPTTPTGF